MTATRETVDAIMALLDEAQELANGLGWQETPGDAWNFGGYVRRQLTLSARHIDQAAFTLADRGYVPALREGATR